ncbi:MAG: S8 family peptidase [Chloroflexi bacterium]|nr:S8 family peptidase [Chloroflexota bacterium]
MVAKRTTFAQVFNARWLSKLNNKLTRLLLSGSVAALCFLTIGFPFTISFAATTPQTPLRVHAALIALASEQPNAQVNVIVQQSGSGAEVEAAVAQVGGRIMRHLTLINALAVQLRASAVVDLGRTPGVRWISLDSVAQSSFCFWCIDTNRLASAYISTIGADKVWNRPPYLQGQKVGVAVVDSGISMDYDLNISHWGGRRLVAKFVYNGNPSGEDFYGHGDHVARIIGSNGGFRNEYMGVAPEANLINVKVANDEGRAKISDVISGLQWIFDNRDRYNIRVVNISMNDSVLESHHTSALDAAVEILWFNGIVVVVSAGNTGNGGIYAPANDPFVITVGATDDQGTTNLNDDVMASFSAYGTTSDGYAKPDLVAPGTNIVSMVKRNTLLVRQHPANIVQTNRLLGLYFRMSGTSMSTPMVAGAAALLIQSDPRLTPDQVKYRLMHTARPFDTALRAGAGYLDIDAAIRDTSMQKENQALSVSKLLWDDLVPLLWDSVTQGSVNWRGHGTAFWGAAAQNGDLNNSVVWGSDYWDNARPDLVSVALRAEPTTDNPEFLTEDTFDLSSEAAESAEPLIDGASFNQHIFLPYVAATAP